MRSILFDLYGTLIDIHTDEECVKFWEKLARKTKKYKEYEYRTLRQEYLKICKALSNEKEEIEILDVFENLYDINRDDAIVVASIFRRLSTEYIKLYPYVKKTLKKLRKSGNKLYVLSNAQSAFTILELQKLDIIDCFDGIAISSDYGIKKPNPEFFNRTIKNFDITGEIWMIGNDYECDIKPAKNLGLKTIFIKSNLTPTCEHTPTISGFGYKKILKFFE